MNYALFYLHYENLQKNDNLELINYSVFFIYFIYLFQSRSVRVSNSQGMCGRACKLTTTLLQR